MAQDLGISAGELRQLANYGPEEADLLRQRMTMLGINPEELARSEPATLRDLQRLCTMCTSRGRCARDIAKHSAGPSWQAWRNYQAWRDYCPNAATLNMLGTLKISSDVRDGNHSPESRLNE